MNRRYRLATLTAGLGIGLCGAIAQAQNNGGDIGPDAALCQLVNTQSWGSDGDIHAYSIQTDTWNVGDAPLDWEENTPFHPLMAQNLYRYKDNRLEMIGMSWLKHGFCALQQSGCGDCNTQFGCLDFLGPGCRDPYSASLNGNQTLLGPRSEVNAATGEFPYPFNLGWNQSGNSVFKRLQVHEDDLDPALNKNANYYIEGHIIHPNEGNSDRRHNNVTYEQVFPQSSGSTFSLGNGSGTVQLTPAIFAWQDNDPEVSIETVDIANDGRLHVAYRVFDNGDGTWRYEYAAYNMNSHRSAQAFAVPVADDVAVNDTYFNDVEYHSGEVYTNADWTTTVGDGAIEWAGQTFDENENANALRWGTMYNFAFTSDQPPKMGEATLTLFRPGTPASVQVPVLVPEGEVNACPADFDGAGLVGVQDLLQMLNAWGECPSQGECPEDLDENGMVGVPDLLQLLGAWGPCP